MKRSNIWLMLTVLLALCCLFASCNETEDTTETETTDISTEVDGTTRPEETTEFSAKTDDTTAPVETTESDTALEEPNGPAVFSEVYHVEPTHKSDSVTVPNTNITINYESTFFGTESAVDRDTFHWGDLFSFERLSSQYAVLESDNSTVPFAVGDFTGDRVGEFVVIQDDTLIVAELDDRNRPTNILFTQSLDTRAEVRGTGTINDDLYTDVLLYTENGQVIVGYGSAVGFDWISHGALPDCAILGADQLLYAGDINGDGLTDLAVICDLTVTTYLIEDERIIPFATTTLPYAEEGQFLLYALGDYNSDHVADVLCTMNAGSHVSGNERHAVRTYFGRRDGHFGPYDSDGDNKNLYTTWDVGPDADYVYQFSALTSGDVTGDGVTDIVCIAKALASTRTSAGLFVGTYPHQAPAYDYSTHIIKTDDGYILYSGGLTMDYNTDIYPQTDADHIMAYTSEDGMTWYRNLDGACFYLGHELGSEGYWSGDNPGEGDRFTEKWWTGNTMEPEVVYVDGTYYMFWQVENYCINEDGTLMGADRIGVATSTDGIHFERKTDIPAIVTDDIYSWFHHQEVLYVPDDPDGKCWWMYVVSVHKNGKTELGGTTKVIRLRSSDPTCFDMSDGYDEVSGWHSTGNQLGYISNYDGNGNRLFVRLTTRDVIDNGYDHQVPALYVSFDGLNWVDIGISLAGADMSNEDERSRHSLYFLGMSTVNGTGELYRNENGEYEFIYVGCTSTSAVAPAIFHSSEGMGTATFTLDING